MRTIVTDIDIERPKDDEHYTVYYRQGELAGNMLLPQEAVDIPGKNFIKAAQEYVDAHGREVPHLKELPRLDEAGPVTRYLVNSSISHNSGMVSVGRNQDEVESFLAEIQEQDISLRSFADVIKSLEADLKKYPVLRDSIEYSSPDEYCPAGEPLILSYTTLGSSFANKIDVARDKLIYVDTSELSEHDFESLCRYMERGTKQQQESFGTVHAGDVCIDIDACYNMQEDRPDIKFICYVPSDKGAHSAYAEPVKGYPYEEFYSDFGLREAIEVGVCTETGNFGLFKSELQEQLEIYAQERIADNFPQKGLDALLSKERFWQCMRAKEEWPSFTVMPSPTDFAHNKSAERYDDVEIIPPGFHDETEPSTDTYPVIADDDDFLYIEEDYWHKKSADIHARYRLVLKDAEMSCKALGDLASTCPVNGALASSNRFDEVHKKAKELLPKMKEARERLDTMYETAVTIRTASSNMTNQFMQVYWNAYNSPNMTDKDDHEAACCQAIRHCMDMGATQSEVLKLVDTKAPMAVWEKDGQYAIRTVAEVNREIEAAKESSTDRIR